MLIRVKVHASSSENSVKEIGEGAYEVFVKKPAKENKANAEVVKVLRKFFKKPCRIVRGKRDKNKVVLIEDED